MKNSKNHTATIVLVGLALIMLGSLMLTLYKKWNEQLTTAQIKAQIKPGMYRDDALRLMSQHAVQRVTCKYETQSTIMDVLLFSTTNPGSSTSVLIYSSKAKLDTFLVDVVSDVENDQLRVLKSMSQCATTDLQVK